MKRFAIAALVVALLAAGWVTVAPWALERFPGHVDRTTNYSGTVTAVTATGAVTRDIAITQHTKSTGSSFARTQLRETTSASIARQTTSSTNQYKLDRRSMQRVGGDAAGTYESTLPPGVSGDETYSLWDADTNRPYDLTGVGADRTIHGMRTADFVARLESAPLTDGARRRLGLPATTTALELASRAGIDVGGLGTALASALPVATLATVQAGLAKPIELVYSKSLDALVSVEPETGGVLAVRRVVEHIRVTPDVSGLLALGPALLAANNPGITQAVQTLSTLATAPATEVVTFRYGQTPASIAAAANDLHGYRTARRALRQAVPLTLVAAALALGVTAIVLDRRERAARAGRLERRWHEVAVAIDRRHPIPVHA